ncbi:integral membrane protein [Cordyceps fumosorosea ARSEF 2679]|uniref:Integral membrane protein n=1 Tax=Cordyceps fumosorosea (strain ARSEF 2679) TaxID=1081104 RepID=A0A168B273_CORFA|nr:integral membrane protein [Cordyceps fumosorosea ARSEF 2679]OAA69515.1 integral membrane protein [Cordyceps fumosorosea ARSEF 2679]
MYHGHWNHTTPTEMPHSPVEEHWRTTLPAVSLTFGILASAVFVLRVFAARFTSCKLRAEDVLMGVGVVLMWGTVASVLMKAYNGVGLREWEIPKHRRFLLNFGSFLLSKFWAGSMACCKVAIVLFLRRVVGFKRSVNAALVAVAVVSVLWALGVILFSTFACQPVSFYWDRSAQNGHCLPRRHYKTGNIVFAVFGMVTDIVILIIPLPTLWRSQMRRKQKIAMTGVLSIGLLQKCLYIQLAADRAVLLPRLGAHFKTVLLTKARAASSALESLWCVLENEFAVICGCTPQIAPLFRSLRPSKAKVSGYAGMYDTSVLGKHNKMSVIRTTVIGTGGEAMPGLRPSPRDGRSSSEIELKGIEVRTAINQEVSGGGVQLHDAGRVSVEVEKGNYTRI